MDELQNLEDLLSQLLKGIQDVIQSGEILTDEFQGILAKELEYLTGRIDQLKSGVDQVPPIPPKEPELNAAMPSSNIGAFGYDEDQGRLLVQFLGQYPNRQGPIYAYGGVPKQIFDLFRKGAVPARTNGKNRWGKWWKGKVPSAGASMYTLIKEGGYPYEKIS